MSKYDDRPYKVGKGKPPVEHRWKKGQSGNPRGRPKKRDTRRALVRDLLVEILDQQVQISTPQGTLSLTKREAALMTLANDFLTGTPAHRLRAFPILSTAGAFDVPPAAPGSSSEGVAKLVERLAEEARRVEAGLPGSKRGG